MAVCAMISQTDANSQFNLEMGVWECGKICGQR